MPCPYLRYYVVPHLSGNRYHPPQILVHPPQILIHPPQILVHPPQILVHPPQILIHPPQILVHLNAQCPMPNAAPTLV
ncbi:hypothetical protein H6G97_07990 [Nostoc flagelliforme FACHB-838]|uniref:Uncharacterized protein n=1 Tax=Nostoc flagelliforme FACHB-838 TaxID=2692904 RepID=A0ABR8DJ51_9NOSO|nr:hypothetical protein [Nostoc flagelliforme]MBD2529517.1 hypothetical protein [Nostoc flagelliforme FACHB-838]